MLQHPVQLSPCSTDSSMDPPADFDSQCLWLWASRFLQLRGWPDSGVPRTLRHVQISAAVFIKHIGLESCVMEALREYR